jgi:uncharacterized protein YjiS (DUF1127 family)
MSTIHGTTELRRVTARLEIYWAAFQEWRKRARLQADLTDLSDRELMDIGISRGEIDYVASHRGSDPRGIRSSEWLRYLPTVDGKIGPTDFRLGSRSCENPIGAMVSLAESRGDDEGFCSRGGSPADDAVAGMP